MRPRLESTTNVLQVAEAKAQLATFAASCPDRCAALTVEEILARFRVPRKFAAGVLLEAQLRASVSECGCEKCTHGRFTKSAEQGEEWEWNEHPLNRMFLCDTCGNKRCPHAADHRNACTGSNEPGQPGSSYA